MENRESKDGPRDSYHLEKALSRINERFLENGAKTVTANDVERVMREADRLRKMFSDAEPLQRLASDLEVFLSLINDHWNRQYSDVPYSTIAEMVFTLIYVLSPVDLIPDAIPGVGHLDDAAIVSLCLVTTEKELASYQAWKTIQAS